MPVFNAPSIGRGPAVPTPMVVGSPGQALVLDSSSELIYDTVTAIVDPTANYNWTGLHNFARPTTISVDHGGGAGPTLLVNATNMSLVGTVFDCQYAGNSIFSLKRSGAVSIANGLDVQESGMRSVSSLSPVFTGESSSTNAMQKMFILNRVGGEVCSINGAGALTLGSASGDGSVTAKTINTDRIRAISGVIDIQQDALMRAIAATSSGQESIIANAVGMSATTDEIFRIQSESADRFTVNGDGVVKITGANSGFDFNGIQMLYSYGAGMYIASNAVNRVFVGARSLFEDGFAWQWDCNITNGIRFNGRRTGTPSNFAFFFKGSRDSTQGGARTVALREDGQLYIREHLRTTQLQLLASATNDEPDAPAAVLKADATKVTVEDNTGALKRLDALSFNGAGLKSDGTGSQYLSDNGSYSTVTSGEVNTASNAAGPGVGLSMPKVGADLPFRKIQSSDGSATLTQNTNDVDITSGPNDVTGDGSLVKLVKVTRSQYNALPVKSATTMYAIRKDQQL